MASIKKQKRSRSITISIFGYNRRLHNKNKRAIQEYIKKNGKISKLDKLMSLKQGALVKTIEDINASHIKKPKKRVPYKSYRYLRKVLKTIPSNTILMFLERHDTFPEFYHFCIIGGRTVWIDIGENLQHLSII